MRSKYVGVYNNSSKYERRKYRVALKTFTDGEAEYKDIGKFNNEITAAWVYNVHAIRTFGGGAVVNNVDPDTMDLAEYERYKERHRHFSKIETEALHILENTTIRLRTNEDFND